MRNLNDLFNHKIKDTFVVEKSSSLNELIRRSIMCSINDMLYNSLGNSFENEIRDDVQNMADRNSDIGQNIKEVSGERE